MLSICIPNYERKKTLITCLDSIVEAKKKSSLDFEVCILDNCSSYNIFSLTKLYKKKINLRVKKNKKNIGMAANILEVTKMAKKKFIWLVGNDDLVLPDAFNIILKFFLTKKRIKFYYFNSLILDKKNFILSKISKNVLNYNFLNKKTKLFSPYQKVKEGSFQSLINPNISFDFMMGMFLIIFDRKTWLRGLKMKRLIYLQKDFLTLESTAPHVIIFSKFFMNVKSLFCPTPISINLKGYRDWNHLSPIVNSIMVPKILDQYKKNGLDIFRYHLCSFFALRRFIIDMAKIVLFEKINPIKYIDNKKFFIKLLYPSMYIYLVYWFIEKLIEKIKK